MACWVGKGRTEAVVPGRSFAECDPIRGDHLSHLVTWQGQRDLGHAAGQPVRLRFRLRHARLYAFAVTSDGG
jgi:hypothetical protein